MIHDDPVAGELRPMAHNDAVQAEHQLCNRARRLAVAAIKAVEAESLLNVRALRPRADKALMKFPLDGGNELGLESGELTVATKLPGDEVHSHLRYEPE